MAEKQAKMGEKQESMAETYQKWQRTDKNDRKTFKMWSTTNYLLPSFPILSCQAPISILPSSLFCPAKLIIFFRGGQGLGQGQGPPQIRLCLAFLSLVFNLLMDWQTDRLTDIMNYRAAFATKKNNFGVTDANFDLNYLSYFWINFQNLWLSCSKFLGLWNKG